MTITHTGLTTMTGEAALWALYREERIPTGKRSRRECYNLREEFLDWCETQNEDLIRNTGALA